MLKQGLLILILISALHLITSAQEAQIGTPELNFDGNILSITYDITNASPTDKFYVWLVIMKKDGETLNANSLSGDIGDVTAGNNKVISWVPANDNVFLNEEITVEVRAEKYVKSFNKGSAMLLSVVLPGLGQTKMSKGKPYWIMGVASYAALAGGLVTYSGYKDNYDKYLAEESDPGLRADYLSQAEKKATMSGTLLATAAAVWTANLLWVAMAPNRYQALKYKPLTLVPSADPVNGAALLTFSYKF